jgi:hypothetical protein
MKGLEQIASELISEARRASSLFTRFIKEHAEAVVGRDQQLVNVGRDALNELMARILQAQASLLDPIGRHG